MIRSRKMTPAFAGVGFILAELCYNITKIQMVEMDKSQYCFLKSIQRGSDMGKDSEILMDVILHDPEWLEILIAGIADGILILDLNGIVHYVNEGYLHISGLNREQIIGRRLSDVRPGAPRGRSALRRAAGAAQRGTGDHLHLAQAR